MICLLHCYFYYCIRSTIRSYSKYYIPLKDIYTYNIHFVPVKSVPNNLNISYYLHVCKCRRNDRIPYTQYIGIITVSLLTTVYAVMLYKYYLNTVTHTVTLCCHTALFTHCAVTRYITMVGEYMRLTLR